MVGRTYTFEHDTKPHAPTVSPTIPSQRPGSCSLTSWKFGRQDAFPAIASPARVATREKPQNVHGTTESVVGREGTGAASGRSKTRAAHDGDGVAETVRTRRKRRWRGRGLLRRSGSERRDSVHAGMGGGMRGRRHERRRGGGAHGGAVADGARAGGCRDGPPCARATGNKLY